jgi:3-hydroxybutyryl-CoA dehydratase
MKQFELGQAASIKRTFDQKDLVEYAALADAVADPRVVPAPLLGGMFSYLLGTQLPGRGTNYLKQHLEFPQAAFVGDELTATVEIVRLRPDKDLVNLRTMCTNVRGEIVCQGEALVLVKDVE